ncbi:MAG: iron-sulfur cluster assembly scaffold protein [Pseudomonadota bacterium]
MFSERIAENFTNPTHGGEIQDPQIVLENKDPVCGDQIRITLAVDAGVISAARFRAWGCATSLATANILCKWMEGKSLAVCAAATGDTLAEQLGTLTPEQKHCHVIAVNLVAQLDQEAPA